MAHLMTGQAAVAEELVHDAFVRLHQRWDTLGPPSPPPASEVAAYLSRKSPN